MSFYHQVPSKMFSILPFINVMYFTHTRLSIQVREKLIKYMLEYLVSTFYFEPSTKVFVRNTKCMKHDQMLFLEHILTYSFWTMGIILICWNPKTMRWSTRVANFEHTWKIRFHWGFSTRRFVRSLHNQIQAHNSQLHKW